MTNTRSVRTERNSQRIARELRDEPTASRISSATWYRPAISFDGSGFYWRLDPDQDPVVTAYDGMLLEFVYLKGIEAIASFASAQGPLFPEHAACRIPFPPARDDHLHDPRNVACKPLGAILPEGFERFEIWQQYVERVRALVEVSAALRQTGDAGALEVVRRFGRSRNISGNDVTWRALAIETNELLTLAAVRPRLDWSFRISLAGSGLFAALALQLLAWVTRSSGAAICSGCGQAFMARRQPALGRQSWCERCKQEGHHWRYAQMRHRRGTAVANRRTRPVR